MNLIDSYYKEIIKIIETFQREGKIAHDADLDEVHLIPSKNDNHGHVATNAALVLNDHIYDSQLRLGMELAKEIMQIEGIKKVVNMSFFINIYFEDSVLIDSLQTIIDEGVDFGRNNDGAGKNVNVEYVSANPTGPLHAAHARGAVVGDVLASLFEFNGWNVTREYYVNDAGSQMNDFYDSAYQRYLEASGKPVDNKIAYPGEYLIDIGKEILNEHGDKLDHSNVGKIAFN